MPVGSDDLSIYIEDMIPVNEQINIMALDLRDNWNNRSNWTEETFNKMLQDLLNTITQLMQEKFTFLVKGKKTEYADLTPELRDQAQLAFIGHFLDLLQEELAKALNDTNKSGENNNPNPKISSKKATSVRNTNLFNISPQSLNALLEKTPYRMKSKNTIQEMLGITELKITEDAKDVVYECAMAILKNDPMRMLKAIKKAENMQAKGQQYWWNAGQQQVKGRTTTRDLDPPPPGNDTFPGKRSKFR